MMGQRDTSGPRWNGFSQVRVSTLQGAIAEWKEGLKKTDPSLFGEDDHFSKEKELLHSVQMHDAEKAMRNLAERVDKAEEKLELTKKKLAQIIKEL